MIAPSLFLSPFFVLFVIFSFNLQLAWKYQGRNMKFLIEEFSNKFCVKNIYCYLTFCKENFEVAFFDLY